MYSRALLVAIGMLQISCTGGALEDAITLRLPSIDDELPSRLSEFGVYPKAPDLSVIAQGAYKYEPRFPLWSNGSLKDRLVVPADHRDVGGMTDSAQLAPGSLFFKTFSFDDTDGESPRPVETRVMRLGTDGWEYHRYLWDDSTKDADLLTSKGSEYIFARVGEARFDHEVPSEVDCKRCHEASHDPVLGYSQVQLTDAPIAEAPDAVTEQVMGYLLGNCVHCHNGQPTDANGFDMRPEAFLENVINRPAEGSGAGGGIRVVPGDPDQSLMYRVLIDDDDEETQSMPPLGVQYRDQQGISLLREWIEQLEP